MICYDLYITSHATLPDIRTKDANSILQDNFGIYINNNPCVLASDSTIAILWEFQLKKYSIGVVDC
jgi:hypothetical protein